MYRKPAWILLFRLLRVEPEREYSQMFGDNSLVVTDYQGTRVADLLIIYAEVKSLFPL